MSLRKYCGTGSGTQLVQWQPFVNIMMCDSFYIHWLLQTMDHWNEWNKWTLRIQQQGTVILSSVYCLWNIITHEITTLCFPTAEAAAMFVCYCDFKPHLIMFMQTGCSKGADTLGITVLQKTVSHLFQNTIPGFAYRPSIVTVNLLIFHIWS